ncbi:hypothetical protein OS493_027830 [Desmophyllum pertusum]|uniref:Uncharacterized protein n=1 Tax=Desmophyllum pertusum TaxID=174260 RepID=A0A9X0CPY9_9CNID|nr:hypothetical protein OS493_027830 [Desmophyllum pertusum]
MLDVMSAPRQRPNLHQVPTTGLGGCRSFHTNLCSAHAMNSQVKEDTGTGRSTSHSCTSLPQINKHNTANKWSSRENVLTESCV